MGLSNRGPAVTFHLGLFMLDGYQCLETYNASCNTLTDHNFTLENGNEKGALWSSNKKTYLNINAILKQHNLVDNHWESNLALHNSVMVNI